MIAFMGFLIRISFIHGTCWIEKDGVNICHAKDVDDAKRIIREELAA